MKWERAEVGEESGERTGRVWRAGNGNARKKPQNATDLAFGEAGICCRWSDDV